MNYHEIKVDFAETSSITTDIKLKQFDYGNDVLRFMLYKDSAAYDPTADFELCTIRCERSDGRVNENEIWKKDDESLCGITTGDDGVSYADVPYGLFESFRAGVVSFELIFYSFNDDGTIRQRCALSQVRIEVYKSISSYNIVDKKSIDLIAHIISEMNALKTTAEAQKYIDMLEAAGVAEEARVNSEAWRADAEQHRHESEGERLDAELARVEAENTRISAELARLDAEVSRAEAEAERTAAETARSEAEAGRSAAEFGREAAETERGNAEALRLEAEAERKACELEREANEEQRIADFAELSEKVNSACESASADATRIEAGVAAAESALQAAQKASEDAAASLAATDEISDKAIDATQRAETAAGNAESKALKADESAGSAIGASEKASAAAKAANDGAERAEKAAETATSATLTATSVASRAEEAAGDAEEAAEHAESASALALESIKTANTAAENAAYEAERAKAGADSAEEKAALASEAAISANEAAARANTGAERVEATVTNAETATIDANSAAERADNSAVNANEKAQLADAAAERAATAAESAESAAVNANDAADRADDALGLLPVVPIELSASGENIIITDSAEARLRGLKLYGKSEQFTTEGTNLLGGNFIKSVTHNGITCDYEGDGTFHLYGEYTNEGDSQIGVDFYMLMDDIPLNTDSYYTLYTKVISGSASRHFWTYTGTKSDTASGKNWLNISVPGDAAGTTLYRSLLANQYLADTTYLDWFKIMLAINAGETASYDIRIRAWLVEGQNTDVPYETYTGGMPSPNPEYPQEIVSVGDDGDVGVGVCGKNMLDDTILKQTGHWTYSGMNCDYEADGVFHVYGEYTNDTTAYKDFALAVIYPRIIIEPAKYYTLSTEIISIQQMSDYCCIIPYISTTNGTATKNWLSTEIKKTNVSVGALIYSTLRGGYYQSDAVSSTYFRLYFYTPAETTVKYDLRFKIQLEEGKTRTAIEPFKGQTLTVATPNGLPGIPVSSGGNYIDESGQRYLCDEVDFERLEYVKNVDMVVFTDNLSMGQWGSNEEVFQIATPACDKFKVRSECRCNYFGYGSYGTLIKNTVSISSGGSRLCFRFDREQFATVDDVKAWFTSKYNEGNPVIVLGQLETPIRTPLSEEELAAYKELCTHYPVTNITNDAGAGMEVKYVADTKMYIDNKIAEMKEELTAAIITE